jgi:hypothetical protein
VFLLIASENTCWCYYSRGVDYLISGVKSTNFLRKNAAVLDIKE